MPSPNTQSLCPDPKPERRWSAEQVAAVVEAAYVLDALER